MKKKILFNFILCFVLAFLCIGKLYSAKAGYDASYEAKSIIDGIISFNAGNPGEAGNTDSPDSQTGTSAKSQDSQVLDVDIQLYHQVLILMVYY